MQTCLFLFVLKKNQANTLSSVLAKLQKIEFAPNKVYSEAILKYLQGDNQQKAVPVKCVFKSIRVCGRLVLERSGSTKRILHAFYF